MAGPINSFWIWVFDGFTLSQFIEHGWIRDEWWRNVMISYAGWLFGVGSVITFFSILLIAACFGARKPHKHHNKNDCTGISYITDDAVPEVWDRLKGAIKEKFGIIAFFLESDAYDEKHPI